MVTSGFAVHKDKSGFMVAAMMAGGAALAIRGLALV